MATLNTKTAKKYLPEILLAAFSTILIFWDIAHIPFIDPDSYLWLDKVRHIFLNDSWTTYPIHFGKPPLFLWLEALSVKIFGWHWLAITIPHQIISLLYILITYLIGLKLFDRKTATLAAFITLTCVNFFHLRFSFNVDILMATLLLGSLYFYLRFRKSYALFDLTGIYLFCFAAWYTKSVYGFLVMGVMVLMEWRNPKFWQTIFKYWQEQVLLVVCLLILMASWFLGQYETHGQKFLYSMLGDQIGRLFYQQGNPSLPRNHQFLDYLLFIYLFLLPWSVAIFETLQNYWKQFRKSSELQILGLWILIPLLVFSLSGELKIPRYILFLYPIFSILLANTILNFPKGNTKKKNPVLEILSLLVGVSVAFILGLMIAVSFKDTGITTQRHIPLLAPYLITMVAGILLSTFVYIFQKKLFLRTATIFSVVAVIILTGCSQFFIHHAYPRLWAAQEIEKALPPQARVALYQMPALNELNFTNYRHIESLDQLEGVRYLIIAQKPDQEIYVRGERIKSVNLDYYNGHSRQFEIWTYTLIKLY